MAVEKKCGIEGEILVLVPEKNRSLVTLVNPIVREFQVEMHNTCAPPPYFRTTTIKAPILLTNFKLKLEC